MILVYKDRGTLDLVRNEMPFIGVCHLRGDFPRDADGTPLKAELTATPVVRPVKSSDGRYAQSYPWDERDMAKFEAYWSSLFNTGALAWWEALPPDWLPEGWQEAHGLSEEQIAELKEWVPDRVQVLDKLPEGWKAVETDADGA